MKEKDVLDDNKAGVDQILEELVEGNREGPCRHLSTFFHPEAAFLLSSNFLHWGFDSKLIFSIVHHTNNSIC